MSGLLAGVHHVTAIGGDPRSNLRFYTEVLGLRLVKRTVNFDDPFTYHLYYGDEVGTPGTLLTHFPNPLSARASHGGSEITDTCLVVPSGALAWWSERLRGAGVPVREERAFGREVLRLEDPDGMRIVLEPQDAAGQGPSYTGNGVPGERAVRGVARVTVRVPDGPETVAFLERVLGFTGAGSEGAATRLRLPGTGRGQEIEVVHAPHDRRVPMGAGTVHHVAWRVADDGAQAQAAERLSAAGISVTPVMDRQYFRSIYFRIPGGVIFEIATDGPGFDVDEPVAALGRVLRLPARYEARRAEIERRLVRLD